MDDKTPPEFREKLSAIKARTGIKPLTDEEMLLLAAETIANTYTREDKDYQ